MAETARALINKSYYLSGVTSRSFQSVSQQETTDGLALLNDILGMQTADQEMIPYFQDYTFDSVIGQEKYFVSNLLSVETLTFLLDTVRIPITLQSRKRYFGRPRAENITSLSWEARIERTLNGSNIYLYFLPDKVRPFTLWGKFGLESVELDDDLEPIYDKYYRIYLRYLLAQYIADFYQVNLAPQTAKKLESIQNQLVDVSAPDMTQKKVSSFGRRPFINYGDINFGKGWTVP